jgi:RNA polymerase sigma factor (sigma-70 family)
VEPLTDTPAPVAAPVPALFHAHVTVLIRLALLLLGDESAAQDVVRDALLGLRGRWDSLSDRDRAVAYARSSVLNGCRDVLRGRPRPALTAVPEPVLEPAWAAVPLAAEHRETLAALHRLSGWQREAVVLRHCLGLPEDEAAQAMGVSRDTVKSASHHGLAALTRIRH